jgi:DNA-binding IclR family transcriptional regulator
MLLLLHLCCTGLAILSTQTDEDIRDYCDAVVFEKRSCPFILSSSQLMEKIAAVRREGYMLNDQMYEPGVAALGVPIFAQPGKSAEYAISISGPAERILPQKERIVEHLRNAARELNGFLA